MVPSQSLSILSQVSVEGAVGIALQEEVERAQATQVVVVVPEARQAPIQAAQDETIGAISSSMVPSQSSSILLQVSHVAKQLRIYHPIKLKCSVEPSSEPALVSSSPTTTKIFLISRPLSLEIPIHLPALFPQPLNSPLLVGFPHRA